MNKLILNPEYGLYERSGRVFASSRQVAETFGKRHDNILRDIANIIAPTSGVSKEFGLLNFEETYYEDQWGRKQPEYLMTRDGFALLAMGFTGKRAMAFKEAYIKRFNEMEAYIQSLASARLDFPAFTDAISIAHDEPKPYHFSNEINMIYRIIFGMDAKQLRMERGIEAAASVRLYLSAAEIQAVEALQRADIGIMVAVRDFQTRKDLLTQYHAKLLVRSLSSPDR